MGVWQFVSVVWGYMVPLLIEFTAKKVEGWGKVSLAIIFCVISGFIAATLENGTINWNDIGEVFGFAAIIFTASQFAWKNTWHSIFEKIEYNKWIDEQK